MNAANFRHGIFQLITCLGVLSFVEGEIILREFTGGTVSLDCNSTRNSTNTSFSETFTEWTKHGIPYKQITYRVEPAKGWSSSVLHLQQLLLADSGVYHCLSRRNGTVVENKTFTLHVAAEKTTRKPEITAATLNKNISVYANEKVTLKCHAKSSEAPYIRWYYRENTISSTKIARLVLDHTGIAFTSKLILEKERLRDGFYTCFVFNQYGVNSKSVYVHVMPVPPKDKTVLAAAYEKKFTSDESVPLGVVIGIPVSVLIIVLAAALTLYERYSWRQSGRTGSRNRSRSGEDVPMLKPNQVDKNRNLENQKDTSNFNGGVHHAPSHRVSTPHPYVDEGADVLKETSSDLNKSQLSLRPDIDLEWEGVDLKPSMAVPEDDLLLSVHEDLWELSDRYTHKTRSAMLSKQNQKTGSAAETIV